jgi:hypothetical protein
MVEQETLNLLVVGSSPTRCSVNNKGLTNITDSEGFFVLALSLHFFGLTQAQAAPVARDRFVSHLYKSRMGIPTRV